MLVLSSYAWDHFENMLCSYVVGKRLKSWPELSSTTELCYYDSEESGNTFPIAALANAKSTKICLILYYATKNTYSQLGAIDV